MTATQANPPTKGGPSEARTPREISLFFDLVRGNRQTMHDDLEGLNSTGTGPVVYFMILQACMVSRNERADVTSIAAAIGSARTTVQRHLKELKSIGWIDELKVGKRICWFVTEKGKTRFSKTLSAVFERARHTYRQLMELGGEFNGQETSQKGLAIDGTSGPSEMLDRASRNSEADS